jgi:putative sigma-54 modulation protein
MRLELTGRHVDITPVLRRLVDKKLARLERMLNDAAVSAQVVLTREKRARRADVTLHARGEKFLHGVGDSVDWEASMSQAIAKIAQQAQKVKGKWQERKRRGGSARTPMPAEALAVPPAPRASARARAAAGAAGRPRMPRTFRTARQAVRPLSVADAAREAEGNGLGIVIFRNADTAALSVLVRRLNGELTLVEAE